VNVTCPQCAAFKIAELVDDEQSMIAGTAEVAVVDRAFLRAMGLAAAAVHVQHHGGGWTVSMNGVDPVARQVGQGDEVLSAGQHLGFESSHLAGGCGFPAHRPDADNPAHRRIMTETIGVVEILVAGEATEH
jgi:hypothetical protein